MAFNFRDFTENKEDFNTHHHAHILDEVSPNKSIGIQRISINETEKNVNNNSLKPVVSHTINNNTNDEHQKQNDNEHDIIDSNHLNSNMKHSNIQKNSP